MVMSKKALKLIPIGTAVIIAGFALAACAGGSSEDTRHFNVGLATNNPNGLKNVQGFQDTMAELGYIDGENVTYVFEGSPTKGDRLETALKKMVEEEVDLIFTAGTPTGVAAHRITAGTNIPVIFGVIADPIAANVMEDLTRPGGNMTGVRISRNQARRLELLQELVPDLHRVFAPYNPDDAAPTSAVAEIREYASLLGIEIVEGKARNDSEVTQLLNDIPADIDAIFMLPDSVVNARLADIVEFAFDHNLPISAPSAAQVEGGALMAYGIIHHQAGAQAAHIADRVLNGADPGELPVETAEFFLAVNLRTAEAIGIEVPHEILHQAEIIVRAEG